MADDGRRLDRACKDERGFSLVELVVAMTIISGAFIALGHSMAGGLSALSAARQRSAFVELANAEMEELRSLAWASLGVADTDPDLATAYPGNAHDGRDAVVLDVATLQAADPAFLAPPAAVSVVTTSPVTGVLTPYTIRRWVTWSELPGVDGATQVKRIDITFTWSESGRGTRSVSLESVRYPGGLGPADPGNTAPVAVATAAPTTGTAPLAVSFAGSGSSDADGDTLTYSWQFGPPGAISTLADPGYAYTVPGTFTAVLTVTDPSGATGSASRTITVNAAANQPPTASFTASPPSGVAPLSVNFDGSASSDPEGGALTYAWTYGDGSPAGSGVNASHVFSSVGTFTVTLTVTDDTGQTGTATFDVVTTPLNCSITSASFKNPATNGVSNDILVTSSNKPSNSSFTFSATTNTACSSVTGSLPKDTGELTATLTYTEAGGVRTWTGTVTTNDKFNRANNQSGSFTGSGGVTFPITFNVHT